MSYSLSLIDKAKELCGSYYALAHRIDLAESTISQIRAGKRRLPPDVVPILAELIGVDVDEAIHGVLMEHAKGTKREHVLKEILGKALVAGVAGMSLISYSGDSNSDMDLTAKSNFSVNSRYIV